MFLDPASLANDLPRLEGIERASLRLVTQAIYDFRATAYAIFLNESDLVADIGEDITREALDRMGVSRIDERLYGKIDYKRARYIFHPEYAIKQALFVDSKAEKSIGRDTATLQTAQTSLRIRHRRGGVATDEVGTLPPVIGGQYLATTVFVKYNYVEAAPNTYALEDIMIAALPSGMLQAKYNPDANSTIWRTGRNAPSRGEAFRMRLVFGKLKAIERWRVQLVPMAPIPYAWDE